jgi:hypothetical protein
MQHHKYMNNFDSNNAILLLKLIPFLQNGFLIVREEKMIPSTISVLHYEQYENIAELSSSLDTTEEQIQCISTNTELKLLSDLKERIIPLGRAQYPSLWDYADGVDTVKFLESV